MTIQAADKELALKLRHENQLIRELTDLYNNMINAATNQYAQNNTAFDVSIYSAAIAAILANHYVKTSRTFTKFTNSLLENSSTMNQLQLIADQDQTADSAQDILTRINLSALDVNLQNAQDYADNSANEITKTNVAQLASIVALGLSVAEFKSQLKITYKARVPMISQTSIQAAAESTKDVNINVIDTELKNNLGAQAKLVTKTWNTKLDGLERPSHNEAHGQTVKASQPFVVKNQLLKHPGDTSLGASLDNVINCRCSSTLNF